MENIANLLKNLGAVRIATIVVAMVVLIGLVSTLAMRGGPSKGMALLYGGVEASEAAKIASHLDSINAPYEVRNDGSIYVSSSRVGELRLQVAGAGLVGGSTTGYEIFDKGSSFGTTSMVQNINARRALEGELARTIATMPEIKLARVHIVMPKRKLFAKEIVKPTASVALNLGSRILPEEKVQAITHLVAAAIPNLSPKSVNVVDNHGNLLSNGKSGQSGVMTTREKLKRQIETNFETRIVRMLEKVVGPEKVNSQVTITMNFDKLDESEEIYDPEQQVTRSEQRSEDTLNSVDRNNSPAVGVSGNVPGQDVAGTSIGSEETRTIANETINYEISKKVRHFQKAEGVVEQISVAVLVEGRYATPEGATEPTYIPYKEDELEKFRTLVKNTVGFDKGRGDSIEIIDMAFTHIEEDIIEEPFMEKEDIFRIAEYVLILTIIFLMIMMIVRPIMKALQTPAPVEAAVEVSGPTGDVVPEDVVEEEMIDLDKVEGQVRASSIKKVVSIVDKYPEESISVIRGWMAPGGKDG